MGWKIYMKFQFVRKKYYIKHVKKVGKWNILDTFFLPHQTQSVHKYSLTHSFNHVDRAEMELLKKERNVIAARLRIVLQKIRAVIQLLANSNRRQFVRLDRAASTAQWVQLFACKFLIIKFTHTVPTRWIYLSRCLQWMWLARDVPRYKRSMSYRRL